MVQSHTSEKNKFSEEFKRKSRVVEPGLYIIACEGTKDEPAYIKAFVRKHRVRAKVFIAEREEGDFATNPWHLYKLLQNSFKSIKTKHKDSLFGWIMVDRDKDRIPELKEIKKECDKEGIRIAYSSPNVDFPESFCTRVYLLIQELLTFQ